MQDWKVNDQIARRGKLKIAQKRRHNVKYYSFTLND